MAEGTSRSGLSREERRARTQKKIRLSALDREAQRIQKMKGMPFMYGLSDVQKAEQRYNAQVAKWKKKRPEWWEGR